MNTAAKTKSMEIWQEGHKRVVGLKQLWHEIFSAESLSVEVEIAQDNTFRLASGTARVHNYCVIGRINAGMGIADEFVSLQKKLVPGNNVLRFLDMILATLGEFIDDTHDKIH